MSRKARQEKLKRHDKTLSTLVCINTKLKLLIDFRFQKLQVLPVFCFDYKVRFSITFGMPLDTIGPNHRVRGCRSRLLFASLGVMY